MNSISGSAVAAPPAMIPINLYGAGARRISKDVAAAQRADKRAAQYALEMKAIEYATILLQRHIDDALDPATDPRLRRDLRNDIMNRAAGKVRDTESDAQDEKRKSGSVQGLLEILAAFSTATKHSLGHTSAPLIERDVSPITTDEQAERFLSDLHNATEENDDE